MNELSEEDEKAVLAILSEDWLPSSVLTSQPISSNKVDNITPQFSLRADISEADKEAIRRVLQGNDSSPWATTIDDTSDFLSLPSVAPSNGQFSSEWSVSGLSKEDAEAIRQAMESDETEDENLARIYADMPDHSDSISDGSMGNLKTLIPNNRKLGGGSQSGTSPVDPEWENLDPSPDIRALFVEFDQAYFWGTLGNVEVKWSSTMYSGHSKCSGMGLGGCIGGTEENFPVQGRRDCCFERGITIMINEILNRPNLLRLHSSLLFGARPFFGAGHSGFHTLCLLIEIRLRQDKSKRFRLRIPSLYLNSVLLAEIKETILAKRCAGICRYHGSRSGFCSIGLSKPLLQFRPRKDLVETLLHEMIHAYLFVASNDTDRESHGENFHAHMYRINRQIGSNISVYHSFHDEVAHFKRHVWRCNGPCQNLRPYYGYVRRAMNRAPSKNDRWFPEHEQRCSGQFIKIQQPEGFKSRKRKGDATDGTTNKVPSGTPGRKGQPTLEKWGFTGSPVNRSPKEVPRPKTSATPASQPLLFDLPRTPSTSLTASKGGQPSIFDYFEKTFGPAVEMLHQGGNSVKRQKKDTPEVIMLDD